MSYIVSFLTQKGGPGKSTTARMAAVAFAAAGWDTVILDTDLDQITTARWYQRRIDNPKLSTEKLNVIRGTGAGSLRSVKASDPDLIIIDGCPHATASTAGYALHSDLIIIPTGTSIDDLNPAACLARQLIDAHQVPAERIRFLLNNVAPKGKGVPAAIELLTESTGVQVLPVYLTKRLSYANALDDGKAPQEVSHPIVKAEALKVIAAINTAFEKVTA